MKEEENGRDETIEKGIRRGRVEQGERSLFFYIYIFTRMPPCRVRGQLKEVEEDNREFRNSMRGVDIPEKKKST
ncbi:hypothetical protein BDZ91DRAFT_728144 [Kalaharituber pfeilii]|nr:hypothetical protein BDZ91DRAFT_728144 [Kalaharituber pfeilii]